MVDPAPGPPRGRRLSRTGRRVALLIGSTLIALLLAEFAVWAVYGDRIALFPRYVTDARYGDFRIRRNVPGAHYEHKSADGRWEFRINSSGFRDSREFAYDKPSGRYRVLVLGDSFTVGYEVAAEETYAAVLERGLRSRGIDAEVINAGMSGSGNAEELVFLEQEGLRYGPDAVVVGFYRNDLDDSVRSDLYRLQGDDLVVANRDYLPAVALRNRLNAFAPYRWLSEHSYLHNFLNNTLTVWVKRRMAARLPAGSVVPSGDYRERLAHAIIRRMQRLSEAAGATFVLLDIPTRDLAPSWPDLVSAEPAHRLDMAPILRAEGAGLELYRPHGHGHWTEHAHRLAGEALVERLAP